MLSDITKLKSSGIFELLIHGGMQNSRSSVHSHLLKSLFAPKILLDKICQVWDLLGRVLDGYWSEFRCPAHVFSICLQLLSSKLELSSFPVHDFAIHSEMVAKMWFKFLRIYNYPNQSWEYYCQIELKIKLVVDYAWYIC